MKRRFAVGDKVRVKTGLDVSKLRDVLPGFTTHMDKFIGTKMTVREYWGDYVHLDVGRAWLEDWLEPATPDDGIQTIRDAVTKAVATSTPAQVLAAASALGLKVEQTTTYRIV